MCASYLLGIDAGTTVIKSSLFDLSGHELSGAAQESSLHHPRPGWAEADMEAVWRATVATVRETLATAGIPAAEIGAIGVTGQGDGTWLVDGDFRPVRPAILWSDGRTGAFVEECHHNGLSEAIFAITGTALNTSNQALQLRWLQENEPEVRRRTAWALRAKDWLFLCLTGLATTDESDASHTYFSVDRRTYDPRVLDLLGIQDWADVIPPARSPRENIGYLRSEVAAELGLSPDIPVIGGPFDVAASAMGVGAISAGDACSVLGTAGVHQVVAAEPSMTPANIGYNMCFPPEGHYLRILPTMTNTQNLQWFVEQFFGDELAAARQSGVNQWNRFEQLAGSVPLGANGVMYHPYIDAAGERAPFVSHHARAQFTGLSLHHNRNDMLRAIYEGVVLSAFDCYAMMAVPLKRLRPAGGGARSPLWSQMLADALGCPVMVVEGSEFGAKGAVMNAGVAIGLYPSYAEAVAQTVRPLHEYTPDPAKKVVYDRLLALYRTVRDAMLPVWRERSALLQGKPGGV